MDLQVTSKPTLRYPLLKNFCLQWDKGDTLQTPSILALYFSSHKSQQGSLITMTPEFVGLSDKIRILAFDLLVISEAYC